MVSVAKRGVKFLCPLSFQRKGSALPGNEDGSGVLRAPADPVGWEGSTWIARRACTPVSGSMGGWVGRGAWLIGQVWQCPPGRPWC